MKLNLLFGVAVTSPKLKLMATLIGEAPSNIRPTEFREPVAAHSQCAHSQCADYEYLSFCKKEPLSIRSLVGYYPC